MNANIQNIILNFFNDDCNLVELKTLLDFIVVEENYNQFNEYVCINYLSNLSMNQFDKTSIIKDLELRIKQQEKKSIIRTRKRKLLRVAAMIALFIGVFLYIKQDKIDIDSKNIVLTTSKGDKIVLDYETIEGRKLHQNSLFKSLADKLEGVVSSKTNTLIYQKDTISKTLVKNTINVPYGKRFKLILSDGTVVHLNSGSSFTFPVSFIEGKNREVFVSGEAFFDVARDLTNTFNVFSTGTSVEVYGTRFNLKNYEEDNFSEVILAEGSLGVKNILNDSDMVVINPGDKAKLNYSQGEIEISKVNTVLYTSWIDGRIIFRNENINNLITKLERIYDVIIINSNKKLNDMFINATILSDEESIEDVLDYLVEIYKIEYQILNNKIIIN